MKHCQQLTQLKAASKQAAKAAANAVSGTAGTAPATSGQAGLSTVDSRQNSAASGTTTVLSTGTTDVVKSNAPSATVSVIFQLNVVAIN